mmetsp:Transcript_27475/g.79152  ORF Transcript_27475/g.79152 Transcript_27475/m.79152 type:complete len:257 (+) Transcript_27475:892-1662(+)
MLACTEDKSTSPSRMAAGASARPSTKFRSSHRGTNRGAVSSGSTLCLSGDSSLPSRPAIWQASELTAKPPDTPGAPKMAAPSGGDNAPDEMASMLAMFVACRSKESSFARSARSLGSRSARNPSSTDRSHEARRRSVSSNLKPKDLRMSSCRCNSRCTCAISRLAASAISKDSRIMCSTSANFADNRCGVTSATSVACHTNSDSTSLSHADGMLGRGFCCCCCCRGRRGSGNGGTIGSWGRDPAAVRGRLEQVACA